MIVKWRIIGQYTGIYVKSFRKILELGAIKTLPETLWGQVLNSLVTDGDATKGYY